MNESTRAAEDLVARARVEASHPVEPTPELLYEMVLAAAGTSHTTTRRHRYARRTTRSVMFGNLIQLLTAKAALAVTGTVLAGGLATAAATGNLPAPVQHGVATVVGTAGVSLPDPAAHPATVTPPAVRTAPVGDGTSVAPTHPSPAAATREGAGMDAGQGSDTGRHLGEIEHRPAASTTPGPDASHGQSAQHAHVAGTAEPGVAEPSPETDSGTVAPAHAAPGQGQGAARAAAGATHARG